MRGDYCNPRPHSSVTEEAHHARVQTVYVRVIVFMEIWKHVKDWDGYEVSDHGRVRRNGRPLAFSRNPSGYDYITLHARGRKSKTFKVGILVARTFLGERPKGYVVDHIDRNRANDRLTNLRYITQSENVLNSDRCDRATGVFFAWAGGDAPTRTPWRVKIYRNFKEYTFGAYQSRDCASWVAGFVKRHAKLFIVDSSAL